jgi:hypothetical protein
LVDVAKDDIGIATSGGRVGKAANTAIHALQEILIELLIRRDGAAYTVVLPC